MRKLYIFDLDGLLVDTEKMMNESWFNSFEHFNLKVSKDKALELVGLSLVQIMNKVIGWTKTDLFDEIHKYAISDFWANADNYGIGIKEGAVELLKYLRSSGVMVALATSTVTERGLRILEKTELLPLLDFMLFGDQVKRTKPDPEIYLSIINKLNTQPQDAIIFEDSYNGIKAGNNAMIDVIFIEDMVDPNRQGHLHIHSSYKSLLDYLDYLREFEL